MINNSYTMPDKKMVSVINADLVQFARKWQNDHTIGSSEPIDAFCDVMLRGGKRLRGILAMQSYYAHGGRNPVVAIGAARVFEIIQTSLRVVDDIADRSVLRRGGPSAYTQIETYAKTHNMKGSALHYGQVQAMNVSYAGLHQATIELLNLPVDAETARRACKRFHENIAITTNGQIDDIYNEMTNNPVAEEAIESVLVRRSAYYTILSPIELGAYLAGSSDLPPRLHEYAIHTGCAFQITDDVISSFGQEDETGKGHNDDIREGKLTLLAHFALSRGNAGQQKRLRATLGKVDASKAECDEARDIIKTTGALAHARERSQVHKEMALQALNNDTEIDPAFKAYLATLAAYVVDRPA